MDINIQNLCGCGCGGYAKPDNRFINGHNHRGRTKETDSGLAVVSAKLTGKSRPDVSGINCHLYKDGSWSNGIGPDYHKNFTEEFRESIRDRDDRTCQTCKLTEEQLNEILCVHRIHYDPETNDCSSIEDFTSLCNSCHSATNSNREYWENKLPCFINL